MQRSGISNNRKKDDGARGSVGDVDAAVSEVIGTVMLISIVVIAVSIVGVVLWSQPPPEKIPSLSASISNKSCKVILSHEGGDMLENATFQILVDGTDQTANFAKKDSPVPLTSWGIGETLEYTKTPCPPSMPERVTIVYTGGNGARVLSSAYFGAYATPTTTATTTTTTTVTPTPAPAPSVSSITPNTGVNTTTISITDLAGSNFLTGATVKLNRTGYADIAGTSVNVVSPTQITCTFDLTNKIAGQWNVVVINPDGQETMLTNGFTITMPPAPTVTSITPNTGVNTTTISITNLAGTNFLAGATVKLNRTGYADIAGTSVNVVSPTQITCTFDLTNKIAGQWNVVVINPDGQEAMLTNGFTITAPAPTVTSIMPNTGTRGTSVSITNLAGNYFVSGATVKLTKTGDPDIVATGVIVVSPMQITCSFSIPSGATTGLWDVVVTNPDTQYGTLSNGFMVTYPAPTVTSILPVSGNRGWPVSITNLAGSNFLSGATVKLTRTGYSDIIATGVTVVNANQITCTFDLVGAAAGQWNVVVTNPDAQSGTLINGFTVNSPAPVLSTRSPTAGNRGWPVNVALTGTGFQPGADVRLTRAGYSDIIATGVNVASSISITSATFDLQGVTAGTWNILVINTDGQSSGTRTFTVSSPNPTVSSITPNTGARGTTVTITNLAGTGFQPGATVIFSTNTGGTANVMTLTNVNVISSIQISGTLVIPAGQLVSTYYVRVTNTDGTTGRSGSRIFSVTV